MRKRRKQSIRNIIFLILSCLAKKKKETGKWLRKLMAFCFIMLYCLVWQKNKETGKWLRKLMAFCFIMLYYNFIFFFFNRHVLSNGEKSIHIHEICEAFYLLERQYSSAIEI